MQASRQWERMCWSLVAPKMLECPLQCCCTQIATMNDPGVSVCLCVCSIVLAKPVSILTWLDCCSLLVHDVSPSWLSLMLNACARMCLINEGFTCSPPFYQHNKCWCMSCRKASKRKSTGRGEKRLNGARLLALDPTAILSVGRRIKKIRSVLIRL